MHKCKNIIGVDVLFDSEDEFLYAKMVQNEIQIAIPNI